MRKIKHLIEASEILSIIIYINHFAAVQIARQITLFISFIDKLNLRLMRASQYLSSFNLIIRYKINKLNVVFNALFRLQINVSSEKKQAILKSFYNNSIKLEQTTSFESILIYHITLIKMNNDFKKRLIEAYIKNL